VRTCRSTSRCSLTLAPLTSSATSGLGSRY